MCMYICICIYVYIYIYIFLHIDLDPTDSQQTPLDHPTIAAHIGNDDILTDNMINHHTPTRAHHPSDHTPALSFNPSGISQVLWLPCYWRTTRV